MFFSFWNLPFLFVLVCSLIFLIGPFASLFICAPPSKSRREGRRARRKEEERKEEKKVKNKKKRKNQDQSKESKNQRTKNKRRNEKKMKKMSGRRERRKAIRRVSSSTFLQIFPSETSASPQLSPPIFSSSLLIPDSLLFSPLPLLPARPRRKPTWPTMWKALKGGKDCLFEGREEAERRKRKEGRSKGNGRKRSLDLPHN